MQGIKVRTITPTQLRHMMITKARKEKGVNYYQLSFEPITPEQLKNAQIRYYDLLSNLAKKGVYIENPSSGQSIKRIQESFRLAAEEERSRVAKAISRGSIDVIAQATYNKERKFKTLIDPSKIHFLTPVERFTNSVIQILTRPFKSLSK